MKCDYHDCHVPPQYHVVIGSDQHHRVCKGHLIDAHEYARRNGWTIHVSRLPAQKEADAPECDHAGCTEPATMQLTNAPPGQQPIRYCADHAHQSAVMWGHAPDDFEPVPETTTAPR